jgi:hypothetical protein
MITNYVKFDDLLLEEFFYRAAEEAVDSEVAAYLCLQDLRGEGIPCTRLSSPLDPLCLDMSDCLL